jgi:enterochelin esterase-like enzyme
MRRAGVLAAAVLATAAFGVAVVPGAAHASVASTASAGQNGGQFSPQVTHTGTGPTGYQVTFRYYDPTATSVELRGEWYFSSAADTTTTSSQGLLPSQWQPGDFPIAYPNQGAAPNWPVVEMTLDQATGVWSYTTPLPSGWFTYGFYVNCASATGAGCTEVSDPSNPPWNDVSGVSTGSVEPDSEVYVPSDPSFGTENLSWEAPNAKTHGTLTDVSYPDPLSSSPVGSHPLAVYLPPGYNPNRATPYPTLYLSHGAGGNEVDWSTQGAANSIVDDAIAAGKAQDMVVVMTDFNSLGNCTLATTACYAEDVADYVIPYVQSHYNVSANADDRAFGGLSAGGQRANYILFNDTTLFGYVASWSIGNSGAPAYPSALWQNPDLQTRLGIMIGGGNFDEITVPSINTYETDLTASGISFTDYRVNGGHEWYTWRQMLEKYITTIAFRHTTTTVQASTHGNVTELTVNVAGGTTEPTAPGGTVQVLVNGTAATANYPVIDGKAEIQLTPHLLTGPSSVTVNYSGDSYYNSSSVTTSVSPQ